MRRILLLASFLFLLCPSLLFAQTLRIGLVSSFRSVSEAAVSSPAGLIILDPSEGKTLLECPADASAGVRIVDDGLSLSGPDGTPQAAPAAFEVKPADTGGLIEVRSGKTVRKYRGVIEVRAQKKALLLVNRVDLEDYLLGVVPSEMPQEFHPEALKAQAVAARTYALAVKGKHADEGYDLCDGNNCQVYLGAGSETPGTSEAVKATTGMILTCGGKPIYAEFSADCGGRTRDGDKPYLKSVLDAPDDNSADYCSNKGHEWKLECSAHELAETLSKTSAGEVRDLRSVEIERLDESGRVTGLKITDDKGTRTVPFVEARKAFGTRVLRSGIFTVARQEDGSFLFKGKGWGHGSGMCQRGANGMAAAPYSMDFEQILKHYYTGAEITRTGTTAAVPKKDRPANG